MTTYLELPPLEELERLFDYDPDTGVVTRKISVGACKKGDPLRQQTRRGYYRVQIQGVDYKLHRIIWKLHHKVEVPQDLMIDHLNRDPSDNRICNLRVCTARVNNNNRDPQQPRTKPNKVKEGPVGVYYHKRDKRWRARLRNKHLGSFSTYAEAVACRNAAVLAENLT